MNELLVFTWTGLTGKEYRGTAIAIGRTAAEARRLLLLRADDEIRTHEDLRVIMGPPYSVAPAAGWATFEWSE